MNKLAAWKIAQTLANNNCAYREHSAHNFNWKCRRKWNAKQPDICRNFFFSNCNSWFQWATIHFALRLWEFARFVCFCDPRVFGATILPFSFAAACSTNISQNSLRLPILSCSYLVWAHFFRAHVWFPSFYRVFKLLQLFKYMFSFLPIAVPLLVLSLFSEKNKWISSRSILELLCGNAPISKAKQPHSFIIFFFPNK